MASRQPPRRSGTGATARLRRSSRTAWPERPKSAASWSRSPVRAPTHAFSTREHRRASSRRSGSGRPAWARSASARATPSAAEDDSPAPRGTSPAIVSVPPRGGCPARASSAAVPRTNARQPDAGGGCATAKASSSPRSTARAVSVSSSPLLDGHGDARADGERQAEPVVVVRVLADEVHPAGRKRPDGHGTPGRRRDSSGAIQSPWASSRASTRTAISSSDSSAAVCGSSIAAW